MRHRVFGKQLGRTHNQRQALLRGLVKDVFTYGSVKTTYAKTKAVAPLIEKLASMIISKPDLIARRELYKIFQDKNRVNQIYVSFKNLFSSQTSNFTKIVKIKRRVGDDALIARLSFVKPYNSKPVEKAEKVKKVEEKKKIVKKTEVKKEKKQ